MMKSLKEWSSVVRALESGVQCITLRKGGISDVPSGFKFEDRTFALFPTHEHQDAASIRPEHHGFLQDNGSFGDSFNTVGSYATVVAEADVTSESVLRALLPLHIWSESYIAQRVAWKPERPLCAAFLRVHVTEAMRISTGPEHAGCKSWVDINYDAREARSVMNDERADELLQIFEGAVHEV